MPSFLGDGSLAVLSVVVALTVLYWVIRLAVRHGVRDVANGTVVEIKQEPGTP